MEIALHFGYAAAQATRIAHAKTLAVMPAPQGIHGNAIPPGFIINPSSVWSMVKRDQPELGESVPASIPWECLSTPYVVTDVEIVLASPRAAGVVGECVSVNGAQQRRAGVGQAHGAVVAARVHDLSDPARGQVQRMGLSLSLESLERLAIPKKLADWHPYAQVVSQP